VRRRLAGYGVAALAAGLIASSLGAAPVQADSIRDAQWYLTSLHLQDAWKISTGKNVTVGLLDSGINPDHPDIAGAVTVGPDEFGGDAKPGDSFYGLHGTAMASVIAGRGHGQGNADGVMGIAPAASILTVRVVPDEADPIVNLSGPERTAAGEKPGDAIATGIRYAVDHGAQVINMSLGGPGDNPRDLNQDDAAVQYAIAHGVVVVAAIGNDGAQTNGVSYPAALAGVIAVSAVDQTGRRASFSTRNFSASLAAPGVGIISADNLWNGPGDSGYFTGDGSSPAAAIVSGVASLIRSRFPQLSPEQVRSVLERTASRPTASGYNEDLGWGIVQPAAALRLAATLQPQPAAPKTASASQYLGDGQIPVLGLNSHESTRLVLGMLLALIGAGLLIDAAVVRAISRRQLR
jgi:type VII secretion-associated serine protease mycosin